jgi:hypothetical protein
MIFRDFEQKIVKDINESGMSIDAIYFIMKSIMQEIEEKYFEYCRIEDEQKNIEQSEVNQEVKKDIQSQEK